MKKNKYLSQKNKRKYECFNYISFDLFDTLIKRNVDRPEDVFRLIELQYNELNEKSKITNFFNARLNAYKVAYDKYKSKCNIDDIYNCMTEYDDYTKEKLKAIECKIEIEICTINKEIYDLFNYFISNGKFVVIISDMYLKKEIIEAILDKCMINGYKKLFVSCEYGMSKTDGNLYKECLRQLKIDNNQLLHFGDGLKNDIVRAKLIGIKTIRVKKEKIIDIYCDNKGFDGENLLSYSIQQNVISNNIYLCDNEFEKIGFQTLGPLLYGFSKWLNAKIKEDKIEKIYFLAREGKFFKDIYEFLNKDKDIECHYLYVSRRSLVVPSYCLNPNFKDVISSISKSKNVSVKALIKRWGLEPNKYDKQLDYVGLSLNTILDGRDLLNNESVKKLYNILKNDIIDNSKKEYELLSQYLKQEKFSGKCAIVDVGWNGSMQLALNRILKSIDKKTTVHGYYLGINTENLNCYLENINGFLYENNKNSLNRYLIYGFAGPLELSMTATHGTTVGYEKIDSKVIAKLGSGEYISSDGSYTDELKYTLSMQNGAKKYIKILDDLKLFKYLDSEISFRNMKLFGLFPKHKHIKLFYGFGANDLGEDQIFVSNRFKKIVGKNNFISGFWKSTWKFAYMKDIFKLPISYYKIYIWKRKKIK